MIRLEPSLLKRLLWSLLAILCGVALLWAAHASPLFWHERSGSSDPAFSPPPTMPAAANPEHPPGWPSLSAMNPAGRLSVPNDGTWALAVPGQGR